jgi:hypothetical protein
VLTVILTQHSSSSWGTLGALLQAGDEGMRLQQALLQLLLLVCQGRNSLQATKHEHRRGTNGAS